MAYFLVIILIKAGYCLTHYLVYDLLVIDFEYRNSIYRSLREEASASLECFGYSLSYSTPPYFNQTLTSLT